MAKPRKKSKGTGRRKRTRARSRTRSRARSRARSRGSFRRVSFLYHAKKGATVNPETSPRSPAPRPSPRSPATRRTMRSLARTLSRAREYLGECSTRVCRTRTSNSVNPINQHDNTI